MLGHHLHEDGAEGHILVGHAEGGLTRRFEVAMLEIVTDLSQATDFFLLLDKFDLLIHHDVKPHNHES